MTHPPSMQGLREELSGSNAVTRSTGDMGSEDYSKSPAQVFSWHFCGSTPADLFRYETLP